MSEPERPLGIIELLTRIGEDNVGLQNVIDSATNFQRGKDVTLITFGTLAFTPEHAVDGTGPVGLVLWLPADLVKRAQADHAAGRPLPEKAQPKEDTTTE